MTNDVVCGMPVDEKSAHNSAEYKGKTYVFCTPGCKTKFEQTPETYASKTVHAGR